MAHVLPLAAGLAFLCVVLLDAFQTIILPRRPVGRVRITRLFFLFTWQPWMLMVKLLPSRRLREQAYSVYGPLSLLLLISVWALLLILSFGLLFYGMGAPFTDPLHPISVLGEFRKCIYVSGTTLFTLGMGDVVPATHLARALTVIEAGVGLAFVALVIGYVPVLYGAFSRREVTIALLDARAGSPPTAGELLARHHFEGGAQALSELLADWERWSAEMLESHISYPILCYYRSQHDNQSWLSSITAVLDACALLITTVEGPNTRQAQLTFAIARHALVDLGHVFHREREEQGYRDAPPHRLGDEEFARLCESLNTTGLPLCSACDTRQRLASIRLLYEPHAHALADFLCLDLPAWTPPPRDPAKKPDQWTTVANLLSPKATASTPQFVGVSAESAASSLHDDTSHPL